MSYIINSIAPSVQEFTPFHFALFCNLLTTVTLVLRERPTKTTVMNPLMSASSGSHTCVYCVLLSLVKNKAVHIISQLFMVFIRYNGI